MTARYLFCACRRATLAVRSSSCDLCLQSTLGLLVTQRATVSLLARLASCVDHVVQEVTIPFESLSCSRCGSSDVQEVKPETYFCNHCDNVFRYVSPSQMASGVGCELKLASGKTCGLPPIGRCRTCGKAFCGSHQARVGAGLTHSSEGRFLGGSAYPDWCSPCRTAELVTPILERNQKAAAAEAEQRRARQERHKKALAALHAYGFEKLARPRTETFNVFEKRRFGRDRWQERSRSLEPAVPLGNLSWTISEWPRHPDATVTHKDGFYPTGLTKSGQIVLMEPKDGRFETAAFDGHAAIGEALWNVLEQHGIREAER
jgi:thiol-disulfide isomerase/thioredoxin